MKLTRNIIPVLSLALLLCGAASAGAEDKDGKQTTSYLDAISFENRDLAKDGREVRLSMDVILDSTRIRTQHTVSLTPVLVSADGQKEMPFETIIVDGRVRHKVFLRQDKFEGGDPERESAQAIIMRKNRKEQEYSYISTIPYSRWMLEGKVIVREEVTGCASCGKGESVETLDSPVLPTFIPQWKTSRLTPEPEPIKVRAESRIARLQFALDKYDIRPSLADNRSVLDTVTNSINLVKEKEYISITGISVAGYASPEGTYEHNMTLSSNRASSFAKYIAQHNDVDPSIVKVEWSGEDWNGFREQLLKSSFEKKDTVIKIIDTYTQDRNLCEKVMRESISRGEYQWLLENIYPYLRHCMYRVEYEVKNFDLEEARRIIYERPQDLKLDEIYRVARSYEKGSEEYEHAMEVAAEFYRDDPAVLSDKALEALKAGKAEEAVSVLEGAPIAGEPELLNILGVAYAQAEKYEESREALSAAAEAGCRNAEHNLVQLEGVMDQL